MIVLDGKTVAAHIRAELLGRIGRLKQNGNVPRLDIILAGEDKPSAMYMSFMQKTAAAYGLPAVVHKLEDSVTEKELLTLIETLNRDQKVSGILMMMPLPEQISPCTAEDAIDPDKDIDGLTTVNKGRLAAGRTGFVPCTPRAVMAILNHYGISPEGKRAVIIGRSPVVGKPVSELLLKKNATVTICHSHTADLSSVVREADIIVAAAGQPGCVTRGMVKPGAAVIDVGINRVGGKTVGDVDYMSVSEVAGAMTPVPGGVGSVTTAMVIESLVEAGERQQKAFQEQKPV